MKKYSDYERLEIIKEWKVSGKSKSQFARDKGIPHGTFMDWCAAYASLQVSFFKLSPDLSVEGNLTVQDDVTVNVLSEEQALKKRGHVYRFDHSVVVIEKNGLKVTTTLSHALEIIERLKEND